MPDINDVYSSGNFLKATDVIREGSMTLTIKSTTMKQMDDGKKKLQLGFVETQQTLMLNKTNAMLIGDAYGSNFDNWAGCRIQLRPGKTTFQGRLVDCISVVTPRKPAPQRTAAPPTDDRDNWKDADEAPF